jgi:WD40 repeat protein
MEDIFASVSADKSLRIWDTRHRQPVQIMRTKDEILFCQFNNKDGNVLATSNYNEEICFYDTRNWKIHKQIKFPKEVNSIMWNQDDSVLFIADSNGKINLYDGQILEATNLDKPEIELSGVH